MARSPLMETINRVAGMVTYVRENLNLEEYDLFLDMVAPQPEPEPGAKKTRKKRTTKSAKADAPQVLDGTRCIAKIPGLGVVCGDRADKVIHDPKGGYGGYHPFESSAPVVEKKSRRKGAAASSTQSSETGGIAALSASGD